MPIIFEPPPEDSELECGRCGTHFYYELTRCPNCGVFVYEPDDDPDHPDPKKPSSPASRRAGLGAGLGKFVRRAIKKPYPTDELFGASIYQAGLFDDLLAKVGGDRATVERLVDFERREHPQGNRIAWLEGAIRRWDRDNRRPGAGG